MWTPLAIVSAVLWVPVALLTVFKAISVMHAIGWISTYGGIYRRWERKRVLKRLPITDEIRWKVLDRLHGDFFPFGVTDYKLDRVATVQPFARLMRQLHRGDRIAIFICVVGVICSFLAPSTANLWLGAAMANCVLVILSGFEAAIAFAQMGSYLFAFHHVRRGRGISARAQEFSFLARIVVRAHLVAWASVFLSATFDNAFKDIEKDPLGAMYFVMTTMTTVGYGDIGPITPLGQLVAMLIMAQSLTILVVVASSVMSISSD